MRLAALEQHIKRPAGVVGLPGAAVGPPLCNRDGQEHFLYTVLAVGAEPPQLPGLRFWCPICISVHALGGEPLRRKLQNRQGHSTPLKPFFEPVRRGVYVDTSGRFQAEELPGSSGKMRVTDLRLNKIVGSPNTMTAAISAVNRYLVAERQEQEQTTAAPAEETAPAAPRQRRKPRREPEPFNPPRLIDARPTDSIIVTTAAEDVAAQIEREGAIPAADFASTASGGFPAESELEEETRLAARHPEEETAAPLLAGNGTAGRAEELGMEVVVVKRLPLNLTLPAAGRAREHLRTVLVTTMGLADGHGVFQASLARVGELSGLSLNTAKRAVNKLVEMNVLTILEPGVSSTATVYGFENDPYALLAQLPMDRLRPAPRRVGEFSMLPSNAHPEETGADPSILDSVALLNHDPAATFPAGGDRLRELAVRVLEAGAEEDSPDASVLAGRALARLTSLEEVVDGLMMEMPAKTELQEVAREAAEAVGALMRRIERREAELDATRADIVTVMDWLDKTFGVKLRRAQQ